ncbi:TIGR01777 family oxidoreductase [Changchengzhania lutea]|uniref:TIGR01777 family oxidoreductase n=1 Tax=Changchengzhania lutea TaxID=2049305 RepID=UPI00115E61E0|nr:TIGR01777 family oxidoreductase [Changchengzhania lutea]
MKILITGATGIIGQEIVKRCHELDIAVNYLTTSKSKIEISEKYQAFYWSPNNNDIDEQCFSGVDAIIHLAGATVSKRWTPEYKKEILSSRIDSTNLLVKSLKSIDHNVKQVVSASAIGLYPDSLINFYDENYNGNGDSFLAEVVTAWETVVGGFSELGILVSKVRIGLVLSNNGGALPQMVKPIKFGVGAAFGSGQQWQSWIHIEDLSCIFVYVVQHRLDGVYNGVAPNPVTNKELTQSIANTLNKPLILPNIPKIFMKLILGEMHVLLFESQRVSSKKIEEQGYYFKFYQLKSALKDLL